MKMLRDGALSLLGFRVQTDEEGPRKQPEKQPRSRRPKTLQSLRGRASNGVNENKYMR